MMLDLEGCITFEGGGDMTLLGGGSSKGDLELGLQQYITK